MIKIPERFYRAALAKKLSPRQIEVCYLVGTGKSWKQISAALGVSIFTVDYHARAVARRVGVWNCVSAFARLLHFE